MATVTGPTGSKKKATKKEAVAHKKRAQKGRRLARRARSLLSPEYQRYRQRGWIACELVGRLANHGLVDPTIAHLLIDAFVDEEDARKPAEVLDQENKLGMRRRRHGATRFETSVAERAFDKASGSALDFLIAEAVHATKGIARAINEGQVQRLVTTAWDKAFVFACEDEKRRPPSPAKKAKKRAVKVKKRAAPVASP